MSEDHQKFTADFEAVGADETIRKTRALINELNAAAAAFRRLAAESKKASESGGRAGLASDPVSPELQRIRELRARLNTELNDLRNGYKGRDRSYEEEKRETTLLHRIKRTQLAEEIQVKRESRRQENEFMAGQKAHIRWISRTMQMVGLGRFAPTGSAGASVLGALQASGIPGVATSSGGIGPVGWLGIGGAAAFAGGLALTSFANKRMLGKSPGHQMGMEVAGYVNPFEANESTRTLSKTLQLLKQKETQGELEISRATGRVLNAVGIAASAAGKEFSYFTTLAKQTILPVAVRQALAGHTGSREDFTAFEKAQIAEASSAPGRQMREAAKRLAEPGIGEVLAMRQMTDPIAAASRPSSDLARMGLYASRGEGEAVRSSIAWQQELIEVLKRVGVTLESITRDADAAKSGAGSRAMSR